MKGLLKLVALVAVGVWLWAGGFSMLTAAVGSLASLVAGLGWLLLACAALVTVLFISYRWFKSRRKSSENGTAPLASPLAWQGGANASAVNSVTIHVSGGK